MEQKERELKENLDQLELPYLSEHSRQTDKMIERLNQLMGEVHEKIEENREEKLAESIEESDPKQLYHSMSCD